MTQALVTGGTAGIGLAFAHRLAGEGYDLVLVARDAERLAETARGIEARAGVGVEVLAADLGDPADVQRVAERLCDERSPVDLLVNNAGFGIHAPLAARELSRHLRGMDVMCRAVLVLGGAAAETMARRGRGTIINVSSVAGFLAMSGYSALKAWVTTYSESLAVELRGTGVRVTALCPGWVGTEFHDRAGIPTSTTPSWLWLEGEYVAAVGLRHARRGRVLSVPGLRYRVAVAALRLLPRRAVRAISGRLSSRRRAAASAKRGPAA